MLPRREKKGIETNKQRGRHILIPKELRVDNWGSQEGNWTEKSDEFNSELEGNSE